LANVNSAIAVDLRLARRSSGGKQHRRTDFLLSERRDVAAAKRLFIKAMKKHGTPRVITLDAYAAYAASHRAITELKSVGTAQTRIAP
jgi:transposase-like protein